MLRRDFLAALAGTLAIAPASGVQGEESLAASSCRGPAWQRLPQLHRGFNIPGWVGAGGTVAPDWALLADLHGMGFRAVRLPIDPQDLVASTGRGVAVEAAATAGQLQRLGYAVTLDMHCGGEMVSLFDSDPILAKSRVEEAWNVLLREVAFLPETSTFLELLNEPPMSARDWHVFGAALALQVRRQCPSHTLIWGPARYQALWELPEAIPPADQNFIVAVHYYEPLSFTHQGAEWSGPALGALHGVPFPGKEADAEALMAELARSGQSEALQLLEQDFAESWNAQRVEALFRQASEWARENRWPLLLNEFGAYAPAANRADRLAWIGAVCAAAESVGIPWTSWEVDGGFGFVGDRMDRDSVDHELVAAMLGSGIGLPSPPSDSC